MGLDWRLVSRTAGKLKKRYHRCALLSSVSFFSGLLCFQIIRTMKLSSIREALV